MSKLFIISLYSLFLAGILCENVVHYISPSGAGSKDGTKENPWSWDWNTISRNLRNEFQKSNYVDTYTLYFSEGDYYVDEYGITLSKMYSHQYIRFYAEPGARVRIIGGKKLPAFQKYPNNDKIWVTEIDPTSSSGELIFNGKRLTSARAPKSWNYDRIWNYYTTTDPNDSSYINRHYIVSEELINILSLLSKEELTQAKLICKHHYHTEKDNIINIDKTKNEIITNVTKEREDYIKSLPIQKDDLFYIENVFNFLSEPNEYFIFKNGTILLYPDESEDIENSEIFILTSGWFGFHTNQNNNARMGNFEVKDIEILGASSYGVYISNAENITLDNLTIHHSGGGISIQACNNITIKHCYINDVSKYGQYISKSDNIITHNNIIRNFLENHGIEVADNNNTQITNNEISGGFAAGILIKSHSAYDMTTIRNILVKDNHVHHIGFGINNDIGAIQVLQETNGLIVDHNHFHDVYSESYAGHLLYLGTGTAGAYCKNNLIHDTSISAFKIDLGMETTLENNIFAYEGLYSLGWTTNKKEYHEFNIHKNIFLVTTGILMVGPWNDEDADMTINNNLYWHATKGKDGIKFRYLDFDQWKERGFDTNSIIADPMFKDHENRDFSFIDDTNIKKIGFEVFSLDFGVTGEDYWLELANGKKYNTFHENQILPPTLFYTSGSTDFEQENDNFLKNCTITQRHSIIEFTEIEKYSGKKSLRFAAASKAANSNMRPEISVPCNYEQGHGTFSFRFYVKDIKNKIQINFDSFLYITIYDGKITVSDETLNYEANEWNELSIYIDFGNSKTKSTYDLKLNNVLKTGKEINYSTLSTFKIQMVETKNDTYIDDLICKTDYEKTKYFREAYNINADIMNKKHYENIFPNSDENNVNSNDDGNNGMFNIIYQSKICLLSILFLL